MDYIIKPNKDRLWSSLFVEARIAGTGNKEYVKLESSPGFQKEAHLWTNLGVSAQKEGLGRPLPELGIERLATPKQTPAGQ